MKKTMRLLVVTAVAVWCCSVFAARPPHHHHDGDGLRPWLPIGMSIIAPPVQLPNPHHSLFGVMLNLGYGQMTDVCILDLGLVNNATRDMIGLEVGAVNLAGTCIGAQIGAVNVTDTLCGVQVGAVNVTSDLNGLQLGVLNFSAHGGAWVFPILNFGF